MFILSILSLYNTILCFSLCPYFIINEYELACDWATYININGSLQVMYDAIGVILQCTLLLAIVYIALAVDIVEFGTFC